MNIEPDIFDYLQTTSLEPHDDYTSEITYKDQKIIWNRLQEQDKEIERLNKKYNKALELLADYNMPCEYEESKIPDDYCEENCDVDDEIYKKCWNKYIELELKGDSSNGKTFENNG